MSDFAIAAALMKDASLAALVGKRVALAQLDQGTPYPALVYQLVSSNARPYLAGQQEPGKTTFRLQLNPLAKTINEITAIHAAARTLCMRLDGETVAGCRIIHVEAATVGNYDKDNAAGVWTRPADYLITFEE